VSARAGLLSDGLAMAVQLEVGRLREAGEDHRLAVLERLREVQARDGTTGPVDAMLYGGNGAGRAFAATVHAVAVLSFAPGGVTFDGRLWCASHHPGGVAAEGICTACLREEITAKGRPS
jgi:hypothetical protein